MNNCNVWDVVKVPFPYPNRPVHQYRPTLSVTACCPSSCAQFHFCHGRRVLKPFEGRSRPEWPALAPLCDHTYTDMTIYMTKEGVLWNPLYLSHWPKPKHT